jgi:hypothetical protein
MQVYQGTFSVRGYRLGRAAAMLYRLQPSLARDDSSGAEVKPLPVPVGYAPGELASLNTPATLGKLVILHCPRKGPINPNTFQVRLGIGRCRALCGMKMACGYLSDGGV